MPTIPLMTPLIAAFAALLLSTGVMASDTTVGSLVIKGATAVPTRPAQPNGMAFLQIENKGTSSDRLIGFSVPAEFATRGELHTMKHENGVMSMREVSGFELAPGATLKLQPGGDHLMLIGIKQPLVEGKQITATLKFEKAGEAKVNFKIQKPGTPSDMPHGNIPRHKH